MELWDLFDENRRPLNRRQSRLAPKVHGEYHLVVVICVVNSRHEILLTLRHPEKEKYPNLWENTGGCIQTGETSRAGAVRELFEETGIRAEEEELQFLETQKEEYSIIDFYFLRRDVAISEIVLQDKETVDAKWVTLEELHRMGEEGLIAGPIYRRIQSLGKRFETWVLGQQKEQTDTILCAAEGGACYEA